MKELNIEGLFSVMDLMGEYNIALSQEETRIRLCDEDMAFTCTRGGQWSSFTENSSVDSRIRYELNIILAIVNQAYGLISREKLDIKIEATGVSNKLVGDLLDKHNHLLRKYLYTSDFQDVKNQALKEALICGIGAWEVVLKRKITHDKEIYTELAYKYLDSAYKRVFWSGEGDCEKASTVFVVNTISKSDFIGRYGKVTSSISLPHSFGILSRAESRSIPARSVVNIDYLVIYKRIKLYYSINKKGSLKYLGLRVPKFLKSQIIDKDVIYRLVTDGNSLLEPPELIPGDIMPVVVLNCYKARPQGSEHSWGVASFTKDAQRLYNSSISLYSENMALSSRDFLVMTPEQVADREEEYRNLYAHNKSILIVKDVERKSGQLLERLPATVSAEKVLSLAQEAKNVILQISGQFGGMIRETIGDDTESGRALAIKQTISDLGKMEPYQHLLSSLGNTAKISMAFLRTMYKENEDILIKSPDGTLESVSFSYLANPEDFNIASVVSESFTSLKDKDNTVLRDLMVADPSLFPIMGDIYLKTLDLSVPIKDELVSRHEKTFPSTPAQGPPGFSQGEELTPAVSEEPV